MDSKTLQEQITDKETNLQMLKQELARVESSQETLMQELDTFMLEMSNTLMQYINNNPNNSMEDIAAFLASTLFKKYT